MNGVRLLRLVGCPNEFGMTSEWKTTAFHETAQPPSWPAMQLATVSTIAQTIQLSLSPVFMLAGISGLLNVLAGRLSRVVDRARALEALHPRSTGPEHDRHVWELRLLDRRIVVINAALFLAVSSAVMTCLVVALLFVAELADLQVRHRSSRWPSSSRWCS